MEVIIKANYEEVCREAAQMVTAALRKKPALVLGLATGKTPRELYRRLVESQEDFQNAMFFNLDEFVGLPPRDPRSFHHYLQEHLMDHIRHDPRKVFFLRGDERDMERYASEYEEKIQDVGGIDIQILGIGRNGHIAFNEPGSSLGSRTRIKTLDAKTIVEYAGIFHSPDEVPRFSITLGIGTVMAARRIILLAAGPEKAEIIHRMVEGPITAEVPGSALQLHPLVHLVIDEDAAAKLARRDYWKWVYSNKWRVGQ